MPPRHTWQAHLLGTPGSTTAQKLNHLKDYQAGRKWLVTGTPFSTGLDQLMNQADLIGHLTHGARIGEMQSGIARDGWFKPPCPSRYTVSQCTRFGPPPPCDQMKNEAIVNRLRSVIIRHTKAQQQRLKARREGQAMEGLLQPDVLRSILSTAVVATRVVRAPASFLRKTHPAETCISALTCRVSQLQLTTCSSLLF